MTDEQQLQTHEYDNYILQFLQKLTLFPENYEELNTLARHDHSTQNSYRSSERSVASEPNLQLSIIRTLQGSGLVE